MTYLINANVNTTMLSIYDVRLSILLENVAVPSVAHWIACLYDFV